jgi:hypothetical protein
MSADYASFILLNGLNFIDHLNYQSRRSSTGEFKRAQYMVIHGNFLI